MKLFLLKKNFLLKTQQNIYDQFFEYNIFRKKWLLFKKKNTNLPRSLTFITKRPRSLKHLYKERLITRQKIKSFYGGLSDKKLKQLFREFKQKNFAIDHFFVKMEQRLDILLFRSQIFLSLSEVQQKIKHNNIIINGKKVKTNGYIVIPGDCIEVPFEKATFFNNKLKLPNYLGWSSSLNILYLLRLPNINEINYTFTINKNLIFEYLNNK